MTDPAQPDTPEDRETMRRDFERGVYEREESQPVEATPLVDSAEWENSLQCSTFVVTSEFARHLERTLSLAIRQLALAQTENAGHIRIEDELKSDLAQAQARCAELEKALTRIEEWSSFPPAESNGEPCSYGVAYGSNGERDYMRGIAKIALKARPKP